MTQPCCFYVRPDDPRHFDLRVLGSAMAASPPGSGRFRATTCRRWGDFGALISVARCEARRHYFARVARRAMRTRGPAPAICSGSRQFSVSGAFSRVRRSAYWPRTHARCVRVDDCKRGSKSRPSLARQLHGRWHGVRLGVCHAACLVISRSQAAGSDVGAYVGHRGR